VLVTDNQALLDELAQRGQGTTALPQHKGRPVPAWTDDFSNLFDVLR
jgi:hypothetical protein